MKNKLLPVFLVMNLILQPLVGVFIAKPAAAQTREQCQEMAYNHAMNIVTNDVLTAATALTGLFGLAMQVSGTVLTLRGDEAGGIAQGLGGTLVAAGGGLASVNFASNRDAMRAAVQAAFDICTQKGYL